MHTPPLSRHRRGQLGALLVGLCLAAGSIGNVAFASRTGSGSDAGSGSNSGTTISVEASVMVQAGMSPLNARQAAANLNAAIDSAAWSMARSAAAVIPAGRPLRTTATATRAFANEVDAALTGLVIGSVAGLDAAGVSTANLTAGTIAALTQVLRTIPGAVAVTTGAELSVAGGADGATVTASLNPVLDTALRQAISDSVRSVRPVLPLSRATVRTVAAGVRQVVEASVVATQSIVRATADLAAAGVDMTVATLQAVRAVAENAAAALDTVMAAVGPTLDNLSDVNITTAVGASLGVRAR